MRHLEKVRAREELPASPTTLHPIKHAMWPAIGTKAPTDPEQPYRTETFCDRASSLTFCRSLGAIWSAGTILRSMRDALPGVVLR